MTPPCRQLVLDGHATTADWFPVADGPHGKRILHPLVAAACDACPITDLCLDAALARGEQHGFWGGVDLGDRYTRRRIQRQRRAVRAA